VVALPLHFRLNGRDPRLPERNATPLVALVLRRDISSPASARRLAGGEAFGAALEQGYCYKPSDTERTSNMVAAYLELVARVPVIEVRFEPAWEQLDVLLDALEQIVNSR
jgi:hypothetical protein